MRSCLSATTVRDEVGLDDLLRSYQYRGGAPVLAASALDFANDWFRAEWERRWPKRPAWLARRLHGDRPPQVSSEHG